MKRNRKMKKEKIKYSPPSTILTLMLLLHLMALLLEHFSVVLEKVRVGRGRNNNTETRAKKLSFPFIYY